MKGTRRALTVGGLTLVLVLSVATWVVGQPDRQVFDISCNGVSLEFAGPSQTVDGVELPDYGASFVVTGYIYPEGTFADNGFDRGVTADGRPEFPELVIGTWYCRGWFVGPAGILTTTGPFVATTQTYDFDPNRPGIETLTSDGLELADLGLPFRRAVTGGSGRFAGARGDVAQTVVGINSTGFLNFQFDFDNVVIEGGNLNLGSE